MNNALLSKRYRPICGNDFVVFYNFFNIFISHDKEEYDNVSLQRIKRIQFHISQDDYFGTVATSLKLLLEQKSKRQNEFLKNYAEDLVYLQRLYKIIKK